MNVLLDESVPVQVHRAIAHHFVSTVNDRGWVGTQNGELLALAEAPGVEVRVTADKNLRYQQHLATRKIALVELWTNHRPTLEKFPAVIPPPLTAPPLANNSS